MADAKGKVAPKGTLTARVLRGKEELPPTGVLHDAWLTVRYQGDDLAVQLVAATNYGRNGRTATATFSIPADDEAIGDLRAILDEIIERHFDGAVTASQKSAAQSYSVALDRGEE